MLAKLDFQYLYPPPRVKQASNNNGMLSNGMAGWWSNGWEVYRRREKKERDSLRREGEGGKSTSLKVIRYFPAIYCD